MVYKRLITTGQRVDLLSDIEEKLSYRTDLKFSSGCLQVPRVLSGIRARIFAQVYGVHGLSNGDELNQTLFRWLFAHTGTSRSEFSPNYNHQQWSKVIRYYFQGSGHYAELALAEKLLFSLLQSKKPTIIRDVFSADRSADRNMATDWLMHLNLLQGQIHLGVQVVTNNQVGRKINILLKRPNNDRAHIGPASPLVRQFLRDNTAVLSFPKFQTSDNILTKGRSGLLAGKTDYQFHHIRERFPDFEKYGRWVGELFEVLHMGIKQRSIANNPYLSRLSYESNTKTGNTVLVECDMIQGTPFVTLQHFKGKLDKYNSRVMTLIMPIHEEFLDIYRDMAGVRAQ